MGTCFYICMIAIPRRRICIGRYALERDLSSNLAPASPLATFVDFSDRAPLGGDEVRATFPILDASLD